MLEYPLTLSFKIVTIGTRVTVTDAAGAMIAYVRKAKFRLKEEITIYSDESQRRELYRANADRVFDFSARYVLTEGEGRQVGSVRREGGRSLWRATYEVADAGGARIGTVQEDNPWIRAADSLLGSIPVLGPFLEMVTGLILNPTYTVELRGKSVLRLRKQPAVFEGRFMVERVGELAAADESLLLSGVILVVVMERERG